MEKVFAKIQYILFYSPVKTASFTCLACLTYLRETLEFILGNLNRILNFVNRFKGWLKESIFENKNELILTAMTI